eukprot:scaffold5061_cov378-Prasinococcus_capsulatus_cf.AAC.8
MDLATAKTEEAVVETGAQQQSGRTRQQKRKFDEVSPQLQSLCCSAPHQSSTRNLYAVADVA